MARRVVGFISLFSLLLSGFCARWLGEWIVVCAEYSPAWASVAAWTGGRVCRNLRNFSNSRSWACVDGGRSGRGSVGGVLRGFSGFVFGFVVFNFVAVVFLLFSPG